MAKNKKCFHCGRLTKNPKFCNHSCSAKYNNARKIINEKQRLKTSATLKQGFLLETPDARKKRIQKNKDAWNDTKKRKKHSKVLREAHAKKHQKIKREIPFEKWPKRLQVKFLFDENGNICKKCEFEYTDPITKRGPFDIHHINGNNSDWKKDNLEILCLNCHWKTENFRFRGRNHTKEAIAKIRKARKTKKK